MERTILVFGYGPGISDAVAKRFGREGYSVGLVGRTAERLAGGVAALHEARIRAAAFPCDVTQLAAVRKVVDSAGDSLGPIAAIHWNAYANLAGDLTKANDADVRAELDVGVHGLIAAVQAALPDLKREKGAVLVTGGGLAFYEPQVDKVACTWGTMGLALAKAAQHKLVGLLHQKLKPDGVYVGEVTVLGIVQGTALDNGRGTLDPVAIAQAFWEIQQRRTDVWVDYG